MVTGVETAGLILGSIPLVVSALEHYAQGVSTVVKWWHFKREMLGLVRMLEAEYGRFLNTCELLLGGLVTPTELERLLQSPGEDEWRDDEIDGKLRRRLHRDYSLYLHYVEDMADAVEDLRSKLELDPNGKPSWSDYRSFRREYKRIKFSLGRQHYEELMKRIEKANEMLANLTGQNLTLEPARQRRRQPAQHFHTIQEHAKRLYDVINRGWKCNCNSPHNADLRLDARLSGSHLALQKQVWSQPDGVQFKVIFSTKTHGTNSDSKSMSWSWQETEIRLLDHQADHLDPISNIPAAAQNPFTAPNSRATALGLTLSVQGKAPPTLQPLKKKTHVNKGTLQPNVKSPTNHKPSNKSVNLTGRSPVLKSTPQTVQATVSKLDLSNLPPIIDLCQSLGQCRTSVTHHQDCLGYLCAEDRRRLGVYRVPMPTPVPDRHGAKSLTYLLTQKPKSEARLLLTCGNLSVNRGGRLRLGLTVASSVLQLHRTPWLRDDWSKDDIIVYNNDTYGLNEELFVSKSFPEAASPKNSRNANFPIIRNKPLFALGIVLIELCLGQSIESLRTPDDPLGADGCADIQTIWCTATRLIDTIYSENGRRYGDAVRRCIYCDFNQHHTTLENEMFRQAVYDGVVAELEDEVNIFYDFDRVEIQ